MSAMAPVGMEPANRDRKLANDRAYYEANREQILEKKRAYSAANRDRRIAYMRAYNAENREKVREGNRSYYAKNRETLLEKARLYNIACREQKRARALVRYAVKRKDILEQKRIYHVSKREEILEKKRIYGAENRGRINEYRRARRVTDQKYRLGIALRGRLTRAIRGGYKSGSAVRDLGCTISELEAHLERQFQPGMTWGNWGRAQREKRTWHIDHIKPLSSFDLADAEQVRVACHYENLRPLWADENLRKGARLESAS